jgi:hypothetical protein
MWDANTGEIGSYLAVGFAFCVSLYLSITGCAPEWIYLIPRNLFFGGERLIIKNDAPENMPYKYLLVPLVLIIALIIYGTVILLNKT